MFSFRAHRLRFGLYLFALLLGSVASLRADERIRIVAANLTSGNNQNYNLGHGNRILQGLKPDVALVQEFNYLNNTSADFRAWVDANFGSEFDYKRESGTGIPNGIVSRYPILAYGEWDDTTVSNRDFMWARIDIPGDKDLWVISVHLLTANSSVRNSEASQILQYIAAQGIPASDYVVLGGDFNTDNRTESCISTLSSYFVTSGPWPVDQAGNGGTNAGRSKPYDWVLADTDLHARRTPVVLGTQNFANGLVFDSRVYSPLPSPVQSGDSGATNMQHMAVVRDFLIPTTGAPVAAPAIYSATSASGVVGQAFSYQIAATNNPTSFGASGLPAGLSVNSTSGFISGTPTSAGSGTVTLSATNTGGTGTATLTLMVTASGSGGGGGNGIIFSENMGTPTANTVISVYATGTAPATFQNKGVLTFGQGEQASECDVRDTSASSGYSGATGSGNVWFASANTRGFSIENINAGSYTDLKLIFGYRKELPSVHAALAVDYWNGSAWVAVANTASVLFSESATAGAGWYLSNALSLPSGAQINGLKIRFVKTGTDTIRIDDIKLTGTAASTPTLTTSGTLGAVSTTYGSASPTPTSFTVSGTALTAGILVTPPTGFEVSQTNGGASGYAATQTVGVAGTVTATTVYLRLAADASAGNHVGLVTCSSPGAASVTVPVALSTVAPRPLVVTALDRTKAFGDVFSAGNSAFTSSGLVLGQTIGAVMLTAVGGTAAHDAAGAYSIFPANASGGTFTAANYSISYVPGTLTVTAPDFAAWAAGLADATAQGDSDGDGVPNLLEYFQGLDPEVAEGAGVAPQIQFAEGELHFDYRRGKAIDGVTGTVEWSADLSDAASWSADEISDELLEDFGLYETRRAIVPLNEGEAKKFIRLRVDHP